MSLLHPRKKPGTPTPGRTAENFFGHRLQIDPITPTATCTYCGQKMSDIAIELSKGEDDEMKRPIKNCKSSIWAEVD